MFNCFGAFMRCWTNSIALQLLCRSSMNRRLDSVEWHNADIKLAYRADSRAPDTIFKQGLNIYSIKRVLRGWCRGACDCICCYCCPQSVHDYFDGSACSGGCFSNAVLPLFGLGTGILCLLSYVSDDFYCFSPGNCTGHNKVLGQYVANWGGLSLAAAPSGAQKYVSTQPTCGERRSEYIYLVYLPNGVTDFSKFSSTLGGEPDPLTNPSAAYDVGEVLPYGPQEILPQNVLAAVERNTKQALDLDNIKINSKLASNIKAKVLELFRNPHNEVNKQLLLTELVQSPLTTCSRKPTEATALVPKG